MAAGLPLGATPHDTAEFMLGTVTVTPIFLQSDGSIDNSSQSWTPDEIDSVLENITDGANWWSDLLDTLDSVHTLEFTIDDTYARNPVETGYEPIDQPSNSYNQYVGEFLDTVGVDPSLQLDDGMLAFNHSQREKFGTDWAFSVFIADSSDDHDGYFAEGGSFRGAFAFPGGMYFVSPSTRPTSTFTHEMGHIFWAFDEYPGGAGYNASRGYYNTQNTNAWDNPTSGFEQQVSIMADYNRLVSAFATHTSPASTLAMVGWQDSDGDGVFDVLDVPLNFSGSGGFDAETGFFEFHGEASAGTLANQNSSGNQSDISINRVSSLDVSIDGGDWASIAAPDSYTATFDLAINMPAEFSTISFRVRDAVTGITSDIWSATPTTPLLPESSALAGYAFVDSGSASAPSADDVLLSNVSIHVTAADGRELPHGNLDAASLPLDTELATVTGISLSGKLGALNTDTRVQEVAALADQPLIHVHDVQLQYWTPNLGARVTALATLDQATGYVEVDVVGLQNDEAAYARVEAYDADGNLIDRSTTDLRNDSDGGLDYGEEQTLTLHDPDGEIASIRIMGHAGTEIGATAIRTGVPRYVTTDAYGAFVLGELPSGSYRLTPTAQNIIYEFDPIVITTNAPTPIELVAEQVVNPWHNSALAVDVNQDQIVTAIDALQVINYLNTFGAGGLANADAFASKIDVTNDGTITALDALRVINYLNQRENSSARSAEPIAPMMVTTDHRDDRTAETPPLPAPVGIDDVLTEPVDWTDPLATTLSDDRFSMRIL
ncbi:Dockerin type I repeat protein [Allorhodopirellula solitaria]|uniref:Dockerin type I repeat protein n=2 Tax=Allorhodopirellula solitaria TaxID=2527987 RepID=A0A5C5YCY5_9BACT|nr:Dockerin type I repeat protein [Allorhodopirellula solitaria]